MSDSKSISVAQLLKRLNEDSHASDAIFVAARLENHLAILIKLYMPKLSNRLGEKLFDGYGPLSSFSAKIDIAYALDLIPGTLRQDLHIIREVRNKFAHTDERIHFGTVEIVTLLKKFPDYDADAPPKTFLLDKLVQCVDALQPQLDVLTMIEDLKNYPQKSKPSGEKSV